jgi:hypothetical protein
MSAWTITGPSGTRHLTRSRGLRTADPCRVVGGLAGALGKGFLRETEVAGGRVDVAIEREGPGGAGVEEGSYTGVDAILLRCECRSLRDLVHRVR